jgi:hypothetical protein
LTIGDYFWKLPGKSGLTPFNSRTAISYASNSKCTRFSYRLYKKGYISDPKGKSASVDLSEAGAKLSKELFFKHFGAKE